MNKPKNPPKFDQYKNVMWIWENTHIYFRPHNKRNLFFFEVRHRKGGVWKHYRLIFWEKNNRDKTRAFSSKRKDAKHRKVKLIFRPTVNIIEFCKWETENGVGEWRRINTKGYIRVKAALPGKEVRSDISLNVGRRKWLKERA